MGIITTLGIDLAKEKFQVCGTDSSGKVIFNKQIIRNKLLTFIANHEKCVIGMEACGGSCYWAREFTKLGHEVKLMAPQYVKPYVKTNKNDKADAEAICEAVTRPNMRFVEQKNLDQQDMCMIHNGRRASIARRTQLANHIRGSLYEYGIVIKKGFKALRETLADCLQGSNDKVTPRLQTFIQEWCDELKSLDKKIELRDQELEDYAKNNVMVKELMAIPGIGIVNATAMLAYIGNAQQFKTARQLSAFIGVVPRQHSSGGKEKLGSISKRGNNYLRCNLVHGSRAVLASLNKLSGEKKRQQNYLYRWAYELGKKKGFNKATIALANKLARRIWIVLHHGEVYNEKRLPQTA